MADSKKESDPLGKDAHEPGSKLDKGKSPVWEGLLNYFPRACLSVADVSQYGATKYTWKGWETVPNGIERYGNAVVRHLAKESIEGHYDKEAAEHPEFPAKMLHASMCAWNAMARLELILREMEDLEKRGLL